MKDARGIEIYTDDDVVVSIHKDKRTSWGKIVGFGKKMVRIQLDGKQISRLPHNVVICKLPSTFIKDRTL